MSEVQTAPEILAEPSLNTPSVGPDRLQSILSQPDALRIIYRHVASGGALIELAKLWGVKYCDVMEWLRADDSRYKVFSKALDDRAEWARESVLHELRQIGKADLRDVFDSHGKVKPPHEWPDSIASCVASCEAKDEYDKEGCYVGTTYKIKLWDKIKANELRGKHLSMFIERHKHEVTNLEDLIMASYETKKKDE